MTKQADLIAYVFDEQSHVLARTLLPWMNASTRFTDFVDTYRDKIRKKIRVAREPGSILDVRSELAVAYCLLNDRRLVVAYEPYASAKQRGPDFAVTYRTNLTFNLEVAHLRSEDSADADLARREERIQRIVLDKLGQMQANMGNLLVIDMSVELARAIDLVKLMQTMKTRAEGKDAAFYATSRYASPADFYKDFLRLSGIVLWSPGAPLWINKQARPSLDEKVLRLVASLAGAEQAAL